MKTRSLQFNVSNESLYLGYKLYGIETNSSLIKRWLLSLGQKLMPSMLLLCLLQSSNVGAQNAYIVVHNKALNEDNAVDFNYTLTGTTNKTFTLNDNPNYVLLGDIGAGHTASGGTNADGEMWAMGTNTACCTPSSSTANPNPLSPAGITATGGSLYKKAAGTTAWTKVTTATAAIAVDGAYSDEFIYATLNNIYFYKAGTSTQIYPSTVSSGLGTIVDVTVGGGSIAAIFNDGTNRVLRVYSIASGNDAPLVYTAAAAPANTGIWRSIVSTAISSGGPLRLDMKIDGVTIAYMTGSNGFSVNTIAFSGGGGAGLADVPGSTGSNTSASKDIAYDDNGNLFALGLIGNTPIVFNYISGSWVSEARSQNISRLTGGVAGQMWGVYGSSNYNGAFVNSIVTRNTDLNSTASGSASIWYDDERIRIPASINPAEGTSFSGVAPSTNTNTIMIPVVAGTYSLVQTAGASPWELRRINVYDPTANSTSTVSSGTTTINVAAGEIVDVEYINQKVNSVAINNVCGANIAETFGAGSSATSYGSPIQATAYHYKNVANPEDGDYMLVNSVTSANWFSNVGITNHTGDANGYLMMVNASYAQDEFYRKRITNLAVGQSYKLSFYAASISAGVAANIAYGIQQIDGTQIGTQQTTGIMTVVTNNTWTNYTFTFTATTTAVDVYLTNNSIGGNGNDIVLDDINFVLTAPAAPVPTSSGVTATCATNTYDLTASQPAAVSGQTYEWHTVSSAPSSANIVSSPTTAAPGTYYLYSVNTNTGCYSPASSAVTVTVATGCQVGYIYIHKKTLNEESSVNFNYTLAGGTTSVPSIVLNDQPSELNVSDLGASHATNNGLGDGQLWAIGIPSGGAGWANSTASNPHSNNADNQIYTRPTDSSAWKLCANQLGVSVDGAGLNTMVQVNKAGNGYFYTYLPTSADQTAGSSVQIFNSAANSGATLADITYGGGTTAVATTAGAILIYTGNYINTNTWATLSGVTGAVRLDMLPSNHKIVYAKSDGTVWTINVDGTGNMQITSPSNTASSGAPDVCFDDNGTIYAIFLDNTTGNEYVYDYNGTTWTKNVQARLMNSITGSAGGQVWGVDRQDGSAQNTIFTRTTDGNRYWLNDERVRTTYNDNSAMIAVTPGTYTITETLPINWGITDITNYDPTANSSTSITTKTTTINVASGEVVHTVFTNEKVTPTAVGNTCATQFVQNFGSDVSPSHNVQFAAPITGSTSYHYTASTLPQDGLYTLEKTAVGSTACCTINTTGWFVQGGQYINKDHTSTDGTGYFMLVNASYAQDEFYRQRLSGLLVGQQYVMSLWAANVSPGSTILPNILYGVADTTSGAVLGSVNTGNITHTYWTPYTFTFTATQTSADIFIRNNNIGGNGNDLVIDDISLGLPSSVIANPTISGPIAPCNTAAGNTYTYTEISTGGVWGVSPTAAGTINTSGVFTPSTSFTGTATISYTITTGSCVSIANKDIAISNSCATGTITINGAVVIDANGLTDNTVGATTAYTASVPTLYAVLFDNNTGKEIGVATVNATTGAYGLSGQVGGNYSIIITSSTAYNTVTNNVITKPISTLPAAYGSVGENIGTSSGSDSKTDGIIELGSISSNISNANFGIEQKPLSTASTSITYATNVANQVVPTLTGTDPEDGTYNGTSNTNTVQITSLPVNSGGTSDGNLFYNGVKVTVGQIIASYNPSLLSFTATNGTSSTFTFSEIDAAGLASATPGTVTLNYPVVLPVVFGSFTAQPKECTVALSFEILSELNNDHFVIQYSSDATTWKSLTTISSKGAGIYAYTDATPANGTGYYRIQQVDIDGHSTFSKTISVYSNCGGKLTIAAYPNPVSNVVTLTGATLGSKLVLVDLTGKMLSQQNATGSGIDQVYMHNIATGLYILKVTNTDGSSATIKLSKQ